MSKRNFSKSYYHKLVNKKVAKFESDYIDSDDTDIEDNSENCPVPLSTDFLNYSQYESNSNYHNINDLENNSPISSGNNSCSSDNEEDASIPSLHSELASWVTQYNISRNASDTLVIFKKYNIRNIPLSSKTLLQTP